MRLPIERQFMFTASPEAGKSTSSCDPTQMTYTPPRVQKDRVISVVLFDVGGVLVEASGVGTMLAWMRHRVTAEELWRMWLTNPAVRAFETGKVPPDEFADQIIAALEITPETQPRDR